MRTFTALRLAILLVVLLHQAAWATSKSGTVTYTVTPTVSENSKTVTLWLPYPLSNEYQEISDVRIKGNFATSGVYRDAKSAAVFLYAEWNDLKEKPQMSMSFHTTPNFHKGGDLENSNEPIPADIRERYLSDSPEAPIDFFKDTATKLTKGKRSVLDKARAVYEWTVENTFRDPNVKGCGLGAPDRTMTECRGGGKCADLSAVFVTLARAAGVPARDVYGLRMADPKNGEITADFHCWAEFYLPGHGWVMVDPADVRKMMLVNKLEPNTPDALKWKEFFWNGDDLFRIILNKESRGVQLTPTQQGPEISYFMYPFAQVDGQTLNYFDPKSFSYKVDLKLDE